MPRKRGIPQWPQADGVPTQPAEPRRGRKKRQTRDALIDAALDLFETKGYEHTAVHEITDIVDVSERTVFRYFASKEDLALFFVARELDAFAEALAALGREVVSFVVEFQVAVPRLMPAFW